MHHEEDLRGDQPLPGAFTRKDEPDDRRPRIQGLTISGNNANRVFEISNNSTVTIEDLAVAKGAVVGEKGGGILVDPGASVALSNATVTGSSASANSPGYYGDSGGIENVGLAVGTALVSGSIIKNGGTELVGVGGTDLGAQISGGLQDVFGYASGVTLLFALAFTMAAIYGQITVNDLIIARYTADAWRARIYAVRYFLTFMVSGVAVSMIALLYGRGGFGLVLGATALIAMGFLVAAVLIAVLANGVEKARPAQPVPAE